MRPYSSSSHTYPKDRPLARSESSRKMIKRELVCSSERRELVCSSVTASLLVSEVLCSSSPTVDAFPYQMLHELVNKWVELGKT